VGKELAGSNPAACAGVGGHRAEQAHSGVAASSETRNQTVRLSSFHLIANTASRPRQLVRDAHANQLVDLFPTMARVHRGRKPWPARRASRLHWQPARWERFRQHGHDLEPLLDACKRMERGSRRDGVFSTASRATWQAQQACYSHYSCNNAREGTPVC
jgi:hypothetical protein